MCIHCAFPLLARAAARPTRLEEVSLLRGVAVQRNLDAALVSKIIAVWVVHCSQLHGPSVEGIGEEASSYVDAETELVPH